MNQKKSSTLATKGQEGSVMQPTAMPAEMFAPGVVVDQATEAAKALQRVLDGKKKKVIVNGERYLEFEDWQTLGRFYGVTVGATETTEIWREGKLLGFSAKAIAWQQGDQVSAAEASCLRDERNWTDKPEFQLKSMAQTRACAKALRNVLAWVAVLAGYKPTPAEEMTGNENNYQSSKKEDMEIPNDTGNGKCKYCGTTGQYHKKGCPGANA